MCAYIHVIVCVLGGGREGGREERGREREREGGRGERERERERGIQIQV